MKKIFLSIIFLTVGCNFNQDPFSDQSESVKNGVPPAIGKQKPTPDPLFSDSLAISFSSAQFYFSETVESNYKIVAHPKRKLVDAQLIINNINEFPGAKFDQLSGDFSWTPLLGYNDGEFLKTRELSVSLVGVDEETKIRISRIEQVPIVVKMKTSEPSIVKVDDLISSPIVEGTKRVFSVLVKDENSIHSGKPKLIIEASDSGSYGNISGLVEIVSDEPKQDKIDPSLWKFDLRVNLIDSELSDREDTYRFNLSAVSKFGVFSQVQVVNVKVRTNIVKPVSSIDDGSTISIQANEYSEVSFVGMDPKNEGRITVTSDGLDQIPGEKNLNCKNQGNALLRCLFKIKPLNLNVEKIYTWRISFKNSSIISGDNSSAKLDQRMYLRITPVSVIEQPGPPLHPEEPQKPVDDVPDAGGNAL